MSSPARPSRPRGRAALLVAALALLTGLLGLAAVLAPVVADDPVVTWPRTGEAPASTVLPLAPYRPLELRATVPCSALRAADARPGGGDVLRTLPADVDAALGEGLVVAAAGGEVAVRSSGADLLREPVPATGCEYAVVAGPAGTAVLRDGAEVGVAPGALPPQVAQLETAVPGADGLAVELRTDARYESRPTALKTALLVAHGLALVALLVVARRALPGRGPGLARPRPSFADGAVLAVSAGWAVAGPVNIDDSWYALMARGATSSGYVGNAIYQFNVTENPFVLSQYAMQAWGSLGGWGLLWLRVLPVLYGLGTYALLRVLLATVLGRVGRRAGVAWALAAAHLLWWLPYGITLRPEPVIAFGTAAVLVLAELARRRRSVGVLGAATAVAALTLLASPTGLVAWAPLVLAVPWLWRELRAAGVAHRLAAGLLAAAALTVAVPVGFTDASLGDVLESTAVHRWYYRQHPWYEEFRHYANLLETDDRGSWGRRLPVLLTVAALATTVLAVGRRAGTGGPTARLLALGAATTALGLLAMALTPTKWVNHFGAIAAPATVLLAAALVRSPVPRRAGAGVAWLAAAVLVAAAAVSYAGTNLWRPFTDWGQPFGDHSELGTPGEFLDTAPGIGPLALRNPLLWLAVAALAAWAARRWSRVRGLTPERAVLTGATALGVALLLGVFAVAPVRQFTGPSVALVNTRALLGEPCGLVRSVLVLGDAEPGLGDPAGGAELTGGAVAGELPRGDAPPGPAGAVWHSDTATGTGALTSGWYPLPEVSDGAQVLLPVTGDLRPGQRVALEFAGGSATAPASVTPVDLGTPGVLGAWTELSAPLSAVELERPAAVRVVAEDRLGGEDSWLAVGEPRLAVEQPVTDLTAGRRVFADQVSATLWPCVDQVVVQDGIAEVPEVRLRVGDGLEGATEYVPVFAPNGGVLAQVDRTATVVEVPSRLFPAPGEPALQWGHVDRVVPDHPVGLVDLRVEEVRRDGWTRLPTLAREEYTGREDFR